MRNLVLHGILIRLAFVDYFKRATLSVQYIPPHVFLPLDFFLPNPLLLETFFPTNFEIKPKIGSHRLPTHRRGARL